MSLPEDIIIRQCLHFKTDDIPQLKTKKVGDVINLTIKAKVVSINEDEEDLSYRLEVLEKDIKPKITADEFFSKSEDEQVEAMAKSVQLT